MSSTVRQRLSLTLIGLAVACAAAAQGPAPGAQGPAQGHGAQGPAQGHGPQGPGHGAWTAKPGPAPKAAAPAIKPVDLNHADAAQLKTLPGIGEDEARKIMAARPFRSKTDVVERGVLPAGIYVSLRHRVIVIPDMPAKSARATKAKAAPAADNAPRAKKETASR